MAEAQTLVDLRERGRGRTPHLEGAREAVERGPAVACQSVGQVDPAGGSWHENGTERGARWHRSCSHRRAGGPDLGRPSTAWLAHTDSVPGLTEEAHMEALKYLMGAYFHQDWVTDGGSVSDTVASFLRERRQIVGDTADQI